MTPRQPMSNSEIRLVPLSGEKAARFANFAEHPGGSIADDLRSLVAAYEEGLTHHDIWWATDHKGAERSQRIYEAVTKLHSLFNPASSEEEQP